MFIFVTLGDFTYLLGVLLFSVDRTFIIHTLPWIVGSGWSVIFDVFVSEDVTAYGAGLESLYKRLLSPPLFLQCAVGGSDSCVQVL